MTFVLCGLGNPGASYSCNRHNIGFMVIDFIAKSYNLSSKKKFNAELYEGKIGDNKIILFKPMTYMNLSGSPVSQLLSFYKIKPEQLYVIHDELDLEFSRVKVKKGGGSSGHNGLKSIDSNIGKEYWRVRFGIGRPARPEMVSSYVLSDFNSQEQAALESEINKLSSMLPELLGKDAGKWLSKYCIT